jgi:hypothetical protein
MEPRLAPPYGIPLIDAEPENDRDGAHVVPARSVPGANPGRRTVTIRGQVAARPAPRPRGRSPHERGGARPDRIAMWAVLLGVLLILVAATSSHAAVRARVAQGQKRGAVAAASAHPSSRPAQLIR